MTQAYVGLGGNLGNVHQTLLRALKHIAALPTTTQLNISKFYQTTPVGDPLQPYFINAVCCFDTELSAPDLLKHLQQIQRDLGQHTLPNNKPRLIDLDILFFGLEIWNTDTLVIPHPRWQERLFVLRPLADLTKTVVTPAGTMILADMIKHFPNIHKETVEEMSDATCTC